MRSLLCAYAKGILEIWSHPAACLLGMQVGLGRDSPGYYLGLAYFTGAVCLSSVGTLVLVFLFIKTLLEVKEHRRKYGKQTD